MKIGSIDLGERPVFLAPMEDVTDISFRLMCKRFGADMVYTEFVSSDALIRSVNKTQEKLTVAEDERPVAIQIYGKEVDAMVEAAKICEAVLIYWISTSVVRSRKWQAKVPVPVCSGTFL